MSNQHRDAINTPPSDIVGGFTIYVNLPSGEETTSDDATTFSEPNSPSPQGVMLQRKVKDNQRKLYESSMQTTPQCPHAILVCMASRETGLIPAHDILPLKRTAQLSFDLVFKKAGFQDEHKQTTKCRGYHNTKCC
jgi:hypothetical protein